MRVVCLNNTDIGGSDAYEELVVGKVYEVVLDQDCYYHVESNSGLHPWLKSRFRILDDNKVYCECELCVSKL